MFLELEGQGRGINMGLTRQRPFYYIQTNFLYFFAHDCNWFEFYLLWFGRKFERSKTSSFADKPITIQVGWSTPTGLKLNCTQLQLHSTDSMYIRTTVSSYLLLCSGMFVTFLAGLWLKSSVLCMLLCPNGPQTSLNWISKVDNRR